MTFVPKPIANLFASAFPTPAYLTFEPAVVSISSDAIYFLNLKQSKNELIPEKFEKIPFGKNIKLDNADLLPEDRNIVVNSLKKIKQKYKLRYIVSSLPEHETYIFKTVLPKNTKKEAASFIRYQMDENIPLPANEVNFSYSITGELNKKGDIGAVVSAFPKRVSDLYSKIFFEAGLIPISFVAESLALSRSVIKVGDAAPYLSVALFSDRIVISILENGIVQYVTNMQSDTSKIISSLQSPEALSLKEELNKVLIYWFTSKKDFYEHKKIETGYLTGLYADNNELIDFLEKTLKINIDTANVWINCFDSKKFTPKIDQKTALEYAVPIGLAINNIKNA